MGLELRAGSNGAFVASGGVLGFEGEEIIKQKRWIGYMTAEDAEFDTAWTRLDDLYAPFVQQDGEYPLQVLVGVKRT